MSLDVKQIEQPSFRHGLSGLTSVIVKNSELFTAWAAQRIRPDKLLLRAIDAKDHYTYAHSRRVARYAVKLARSFGCPSAQVREVGLAALLHDVGKVGIPEGTLGKPGRLTNEERRIMRRHPEMSAEIINYFDFASPRVAVAVRHHHEWVDGRGYPDRLSRQDIPLAARILAIADAWDAMTVPRPYRPAIEHSKAAQELAGGSGIQFDGLLINTFLSTQA